MRTLVGHCSAVESVVIEEGEGKGGRCVSAGRDGGVRIWDLENTEEEGVRVEQEGGQSSVEGGASKVYFDEEKIVLVAGGRRGEVVEEIRVLRFD